MRLWAEYRTHNSLGECKLGYIERPWSPPLVARTTTTPKQDDS